MSFYTSKLSLNVILHVTILFTILSLLFMLYITKLTTKLINHELGEKIKDFFNEYLYTTTTVPNESTYDPNATTVPTTINITVPITPSLSIQGLTNNITNNITTTMISLIQNEINQIIINDPTIQNLNATNTILINKMKLAANSAIEQGIQKNINNINSQINLNITNIIKNFPYDYYINIFKQKETFRETVNENLFTQIKLFNLLLIIFLISFIGISLLTNTLNISDVIGIFTENIITFIFVGIIEVWFFLNVASKYIPTPPSLLYTSALSSLQKLLNNNIIKL